MNNRYRNAPSLRGPTKASATTLCQKCLKRDTYSPDYQYLSAITDSALRHYSYECNVSAQERPYLARPSRTQQLQNPNLRPKLSSDTPNDLLRTYVSSDFSFLFFFLAPNVWLIPCTEKAWRTNYYQSEKKTAVVKETRMNLIRLVARACSRNELGQSPRTP